MKIVLPEYNNPIMTQAMSAYMGKISFVAAENIQDACQILAEGKADAMVAGIDITTRDMVLACKRGLKMTEKYFSSCFLMQKGNQKLILADAGINKNPSVEILKTIVLQTFRTASQILDEEPRIAMLSFSTHGSGGKDESIEKIREVAEWVHKNHSEIVIDGEMQLDVAVVSDVASKKAPDSPVAGRANVLICPDLNSGNILYKSMERLGGWTAAGPLLQGFDKPISDLSRGSTKKDVELVFETLHRLAN